QECTELLREIDEDRAGFEYADRPLAASIHHCWDLGIGIHGNESRAELLALGDPDQPGIVLCAAMTQGEQLLEQDRDLVAVWRPLRIELQRVSANGQFALMRRTRNGTIDVRELAAVFLFP